MWNVIGKPSLILLIFFSFLLGCKKENENGSNPGDNPSVEIHTQSVLSFFKVGGFGYSNTETEMFGSGVAIGPVGNDGVDKIIIGSPMAGDAPNQGRGRVDIYSASNYQFLYSIYGSSADEKLGGSVAFGDDFNADGHGDILATSWTINQFKNVKVISGSNQSILFSVNSEQASGCLGLRSLTSGDFNGDGRSDILIGDPCFDSNRGKIYIYSGMDHSLLFTALGQNTNDEFGFHLATVGDLNSDGSDEFVAINRLQAKALVYSPKTSSVLFSLTDVNFAVGFSVSSGQDFDGDGKNDIAFGSSNGDFNVFSGATGASIFSEYSSTGEATVQFVGDFNSDSVVDLAVRRNLTVKIYSGSNHVVLDQIAPPDGGVGYVLAAKANYNGGAGGALLLPVSEHILKDANGQQIGPEAVGKIYLYTPW